MNEGWTWTERTTRSGRYLVTMYDEHGTVVRRFTSLRPAAEHRFMSLRSVVQS